MTDGTITLGGRTARQRWRWIGWLLCGATLISLMSAYVLAEHLSAAADGGLGWVAACIYPTAAAIYFAALFLAPRGKLSRPAMIFLAVVAVGVRAPMWFSPQIPDGDYHRYFWDGAVTAGGGDPYEYSPLQAMEGTAGEAIGKLAADPRAADALAHVTHPHLRTIYPPLAQGLFAVAHWMGPFDITSWRIVLLAFDAIAVAALIALLGRSPPARWRLSIYLWNPLLVVETYYGGHVDLAAAAVVLLALLALARRRFVIASAAIAVATGLKLWPAVLIFFLAAAMWKDWRRLAAAVGVFVALCGLMAIPFAGACGRVNSGLLAYAQTWQANAGAYVAIEKLGGVVSQWIGGAISGRSIARAVVAAAIVSLAVVAGRRALGDAGDLCRRAGLVVIAMLLLTPTLYPWYYVCAIPLAAVAPRPVMLIWSAILPFSYLSHAASVGRAIVWIVHLPVWLLGAAELIPLPRGRRCDV